MTADEFNRLVSRGQFDDCWPWLGTVGHHGYGRVSWNGRAHQAHRVSWMLTRGPIPVGMVICHSCDNPICVNPNHLWMGTQRDNVDDCKSKGRRRYPIGEKRTADLRGIKRWSRFSDEEEALLFDQWQAGCTLKELADSNRVPLLTMFHAVHRAEAKQLGVRLPPPIRRIAATADQVSVVRAMAATGQSIRTIASQVGLTRGVVHSILVGRGPYTLAPATEMPSLM